MTQPNAPRRDRHNKILIAMLEVSGASTRLCAYEDIVVAAWKRFPQEFGLRGYVSDYPDSSDLHKPLYGPLKRDGYVKVQNKKFGLTEAGLAVAAELNSGAGGGSAASRVRRDQVIEIERLAKKPSVRLVQQGSEGELLDSDLYDFYGVTVRTKPADFIGRVNTVDRAIDAAVLIKDPSLDAVWVAWVAKTRDALKQHHSELIAELTSTSEKPKG